MHENRKLPDLPKWDKESKEARYARRLGQTTPNSYELHREFMDTRPPVVTANIAICLIHQTNFLIDPQLRRRRGTNRNYLRLPSGLLTACVALSGLKHPRLQLPVR